MLTVKLVKSLEDEGEEVMCWSGGDTSNPDWQEYLESFIEEIRPYLEVAKQWVLSQHPYPCSNEICNDYELLFSDGKRFMPTWRAWGDFVQAAVGKREGYMHYYYRAREGEKWR